MLWSDGIIEDYSYSVLKLSKTIIYANKLRLLFYELFPTVYYAYKADKKF